MTPLIMIPGFMCDQRLFDSQIATLGGDRQIFVEVPTEPTIEAMAAAILGAAEGLICVAGLSMGGIVAMEMLRQAPDRIERLALLDTTPLADASENFETRNRQINSVWNGHLAEIMRDELKPAYLVDSDNKNAILQLCTDMAEGLGPQIFEAQSSALRDRADLQAVLAYAPPDTLILHGREDRLCSPERHRLMHRLAPGSSLVSIPDAGHLPTLEQPALTTAALASWLSS
ncbi:MAG: alpha/beta fold hydrolase [Boseongicola sp.]